MTRNITTKSFVNATGCIAVAALVFLLSTPAAAQQVEGEDVSNPRFNKAAAVTMSMLPTAVGVGAGIWLGFEMDDFWAFAGLSMGSVAVFPSTGYLYLREFASLENMALFAGRTALAGTTLALWSGVEDTSGSTAEALGYLSIATGLGALALAGVSGKYVAEKTDEVNSAYQPVKFAAAPAFERTPETGDVYPTLTVYGTF